MTRPIMALVTFMIFALGVMPVMAHEEYRVIGVITKRQDTSIQVKNKDGKTFSIALKKDVTISRDKKKVAATELKKGLTVVVDAVGDSEDDLEAFDIRIVPAITSPAAN